MSREEYVATGLIRGGKLQVRNRAGLEHAMTEMTDGEVSVVIRRRRATRSLAQNAWYWSGILGMLSEHTGYTSEELHEWAKAKFLPKALAFSDGNGEVVEEYVVGGSTTKLNKLEFGEYCERIRQFAAAELDVVIPDPREYEGAA